MRTAATSRLAITAIIGAYFLLVYKVAAEGDTDDHLWLHQIKKTYCETIQSHRIYKVENLKVHCAGKVGFFEDGDKVSRPLLLRKAALLVCCCESISTSSISHVFQKLEV